MKIQSLLHRFLNLVRQHQMKPSIDNYYLHHLNEHSEKEVIHSDFERIGKDLFGALNGYERKYESH